MYCLEAVVATEPVLHALAGSLEEARIVPLGQHLSLVPMATGAPADLGSLMAACSAKGPVAYVEAEFFGGTGTQSAQVWDNGKVVLGPLRLAEGERPPVAGSPISQALRQLGATRGDHHDEFDAVGLGRHRDTTDWLPTTS